MSQTSKNIIEFTDNGLEVVKNVKIEDSELKIQIVDKVTTTIIDGCVVSHYK